MKIVKVGVSEDKVVVEWVSFDWQLYKMDNGTSKMTQNTERLELEEHHWLVELD